MYLRLVFSCESEVLHVENVKCVSNSYMESYYVYQWESGGAQERRELVYPKEKWAISGIPDLTRGELGWGVLGVRKSPAWIYNCDLTCVGHYGNCGWRPIGGCWCFQKDLDRSDCPSLIREYPPYLGRAKSVHHRNSSGKASEVGGNRARWIPESRKLDPGITSPVDKPVREKLPARLRTGPGDGSFSGSLTY